MPDSDAPRAARQVVQPITGSAIVRDIELATVLISMLVGNAQIQLDTSRWPIAVVTPTGSVGDEELSKFFADYSAMLRGKLDHYAIIIDLRRATDMPAKQRKTLTDYMKQQERVAGMFCAGTALVFESAVMRAILTAVLWIRKPPQEVYVASTVQEALDWAQGALRRKRATAA